MRRLPPHVDTADLIAVYQAWPRPEYDKGLLRALLLRVRIDRVAIELPPKVIAADPDSSRVSQRLMLSIGEPGLSDDDQSRRLRIVRAAIGAYCAICDLLHARNPDPNPPVQELTTWSGVVEELERELKR